MAAHRIYYDIDRRSEPQPTPHSNHSHSTVHTQPQGRATTHRMQSTAHSKAQSTHRQPHSQACTEPQTQHSTQSEHAHNEQSEDCQLSVRMNVLECNHATDNDAQNAGSERSERTICEGLKCATMHSNKEGLNMLELLQNVPSATWYACSILVVQGFAGFMVYLHNQE